MPRPFSSTILLICAVVGLTLALSRFGSRAATGESLRGWPQTGIGAISLRARSVFRFSRFGKTLLGGTLSLPPRRGTPIYSLPQPYGSTHRHVRYRLIDIGTFGGPTSQGTNESPAGPLVATGWSATNILKPPQSNRIICGGPDGAIEFITHTFEWRDGRIADLGSLGGYRSCSIPFFVSARGVIVGMSENGLLDPTTGPSHPNCSPGPLGPPQNQSRPVLWKDGRIVDLGTFGGNQGIALSMNSRGQIAGMANNAVPDRYSFFDIFLLCATEGQQTRGFLWQSGRKIDLGTLGGNDTYAEFVNERGQVSGSSYTNAAANPVTGLPTLDPFIWQNGKIIDLGNLGGTQTFVNAMNNRGWVVGNSNIPGDLITHPFVWDGERMIDIGTAGGDNGVAWAVNDEGEVVGWTQTADNRNLGAFIWKNGVRVDLPPLPGECGTEAFGINDLGVVAGDSWGCDPYSQNAVLWDHGAVIDLNDRIPENSSLHLSFLGPFSQSGPELINNRGDIAGIGAPRGVHPVDAALVGHAFLLIPCEQGRCR